MSNQLVIVIDFGGQYNQLIARRLREAGVYSEVMPYTKATPEIIAKKAPIGLIFTGGPNSVYLPESPQIGSWIFELGIPILGICYGAQLMAHTLDGKVVACEEGGEIRSEYGKTETTYDTSSLIFKDMPKSGISWMSHTDYISELPSGFKVSAATEGCSHAAMENDDKKLYAIQFHPEVNHTVNGFDFIKNFLYNVCNATGDWTMGDYLKRAVAEVREKVGDGKVLLALSGGVDSSVLAALLSKAIGSQLTCVFVDHGLMRLNEGDEIEEAFKDWDINFVRVNAEDRFLARLEGVSEPEAKRKAIGEEFIRVFEQEAKKIGKVDFLAQGTIYPDVIESGEGDAAVIKSHHNVGGLPSVVDFKDLIEPLRQLFKDEVRALGRELGLSSVLVNRQPFPGPGLGIRIIGDITKEKADLLRKADRIFRDEIEQADIESNQYFAVLTNMRSVGVMGDARTYDFTLALRAITTSDFMTADFCRVPYDVLERASVRIVNEVKGINRIVYDITSKPPGTIEWE